MKRLMLALVGVLFAVNVWAGGAEPRPRVIDSSIPGGEISVEKLKSRGFKVKPQIVFIWDDGVDDVMTISDTIVAIEDRYGMQRGDMAMGVAIETRKTDVEGSRLTSAQIRTLIARGWEVGGHGFCSTDGTCTPDDGDGVGAWYTEIYQDSGGFKTDHTATPYWTLKDVERDLDSTQARLDALGVPRYKQWWAYPNSYASPAVENAIADRFAFAFLSGSNYGDADYPFSASIARLGPNGARIVGVGTKPAWIRPHAIPRVSFGANALPTCINTVQNAVAVSGMVTFTGHDLPVKVIDSDAPILWDAFCTWLNRLAEADTSGILDVTTPYEAAQNVFFRPIDPASDFWNNPKWYNFTDLVYDSLGSGDVEFNPVITEDSTTSTTYEMDGCYYASVQNTADRSSWVAQEGYPWVSRGTGWGSTDEVVFQRQFNTGNRIRIVKNFPSGNYVKISGYWRHDEAWSTANHDDIQLVMETTILTDRATYAQWANPDSVNSRLDSMNWGAWNFRSATAGEEFTHYSLSLGDNIQGAFRAGDGMESDVSDVGTFKAFSQIIWIPENQLLTSIRFDINLLAGTNVNGMMRLSCLQIKPVQNQRRLY